VLRFILAVLSFGVLERRSLVLHLS